MLLPALLLLSAAFSASPTVTWTDCHVGKTEGRCGTVRVPMNRSRKASPDNTIALRIFLLPAAAKAKKEPLFFVEGGPGISAVFNLGHNADGFESFRAEHDIIAVDDRGVGGSAGLRCPQIRGPRAALREIFQVAIDCLPAVQSKADLAQYHGLSAAEDLDDVRKAIRAERINLFGLSHGTREIFYYLRDHGNHVRSVILEGPYPPQFHLPAGVAQREAEIIPQLISDCEAEAWCSAHYPKLRQEFQDSLRAFDKGDVQANLGDDKTGEALSFRLSRGRYAETLRSLLYSSVEAKLFPEAVHAAATGDWSKISRLVVRFQIGGEDPEFFSFPAWMSYVCAEDLPYLDESSETVAAADTPMGTYRVHQQKLACANWPHANLPLSASQPVVSKVPALLIVGELDPATPPTMAQAAATTMSNAKIVIMHRGGHVLIGPTELPCLDQIERDFLKAGTAQGLDTSCAAKLQRASFDPAR